MTKPEHPRDAERISRRRFLMQLAQAGAAIGAASLATYYFYDPVGPTGQMSAPPLTQLPDFSIADLRGKMAIAQGSKREKSLEAALESLGGISRFVSRGDVVLIKVNAAFASPAMLGATTHPDLVRAIVTLCRKAGAREVRVADNPINDPESCFRLSGVGAAAEEAGARLILPRPNAFRQLTLENGQLIRNWPVMTAALEGATKVIGVTPVKDHNRAGASMTMKNWYGLLGGRRNTFHQDIHTIITELAMLMRPTFVVLDGTTVMVSNGPTGGSTADLREANTLVVSTDQVAADAFGATLLGRTVSDLPYLARAEAAGCGTTNFNSLNPIRVEV
ncbi:protein of unknown function (DUF362) [Candidatus Sumerlaea chitinivorans]|uniref:DUF362 domain-containing protein n=1 Tax=Sumerlaea chitinivorans TaxID=2250252 RepID=A0A2Z4YAV7_SUMC1|nr:protein of unknown function (DUF362) [Candidatus Sumerlaea chitinivorans]